MDNSHSNRRKSTSLRKKETKHVEKIINMLDDIGAKPTCVEKILNKKIQLRLGDLFKMAGPNFTQIFVDFLAKELIDSGHVIHDGSSSCSSHSSSSEDSNK